METPRRTVRTSTPTPTLSQVRQNCIRSQIFSPADSGLGCSPATGTLHDVHTETMPDIRYRRRIGHCSPRNNQDRAESDNAPQTWSGKRQRPDNIRRKYIYSTPARTIMDESDTPYDSDEMPSYSCPSPNSPVIN
ncbi:Hypothetical predicted protein [Mytilus galloprovincialis]|uniref:Uncharacterized protein n=1 Tax=Mytilus galloprovincialis TaxID=29158 RepID=A0A8B6CCA9_MYTGA|nr:Hypothetical predicted protein [Mytilus galloprovincialis]